ncbi:restriction endonuclease subunit S [Streptomyces syringium]|uniref:restriction endonuclease subunit S n=1 Tax=Streptomyces syringium TaxID=76729 RepID=UPI003422F02B
MGGENTSSSAIPTCLLKSVVSLVASGKTVHRDANGRNPLYGSTGQIGATNLIEFSGPSILVARVGANAGSVYKVDGQYGVSDNTLVIRPAVDQDVNFLTEVLRHANLNRMVYGSGQPLVTGTVLKSLEVPNLPLKNQQRIAAALGDVDILLAALERLIAKKEEIKKGLMQRFLTPVDAPATWAHVRLLDLVSIRSGQVDPKGERYRDLPLIAPDHIASGSGRLLAKRSAAEQGAISGKYLVEPGDVIYSKIRPYLQKVYRCKFSALCSADMYPFTPKPGVSGSFILHTILGKKFTDFAVSVSARSGIPKINRAELAEFELMVPPFAEQEVIGQVLDDADKQIVTLQRSVAKYKAIRVGMLQELLTGRTRLPISEGDAS